MGMQNLKQIIMEKFSFKKCQGKLISYRWLDTWELSHGILFKDQGSFKVLQKGGIVGRIDSPSQIVSAQKIKF